MINVAKECASKPRMLRIPNANIKEDGSILFYQPKMLTKVSDLRNSIQYHPVQSQIAKAIKRSLKKITIRCISPKKNHCLMPKITGQSVVHWGSANLAPIVSGQWGYTRARSASKSPGNWKGSDATTLGSWTKRLNRCPEKHRHIVTYLPENV